MAEDIGRDLNQIANIVEKINKNLKDGQTEARALDKALKLNPDSQVLFEQKQANLNKQLSLSNEKAEALRNTMSLLEAEIMKGGENTDKYRRNLTEAGRQLGFTEIEVEGLTGALKEQKQEESSVSFKNYDKELKGISQSVQGLNMLMGSLNGIIGIAGTSASKEGSAAAESLKKVTGSMQSLVGFIPTLSKGLKTGTDGFTRMTAAASAASGAVLFGLDVIMNYKNMGWFEIVAKSIAAGILLIAGAAMLLKVTLKPWEIAVIGAAVGGALATYALMKKSLGVDAETPNTSGLSLPSQSVLEKSESTTVKQEKRIIEATIKLEASGNTSINQQNAKLVAAELAPEINKYLGGL